MKNMLLAVFAVAQSKLRFKPGKQSGFLAFARNDNQRGRLSSREPVLIPPYGTKEVFDEGSAFLLRQLTLSFKCTVFAVVVGLVVVPVMVSGPLFAHHGFTNYDTDHRTTLKGTVTDVEWANPHVQIHLDVKDEKGNVERWTAETAPPAMLRRVGWDKDKIKPGDRITVSGYQLKDGSKVMSVRKIVLANGQELNQRIN